jgi:hypothetical protein
LDVSVRLGFAPTPTPTLTSIMASGVHLATFEPAGRNWLRIAPSPPLAASLAASRVNIRVLDSTPDVETLMFVGQPPAIRVAIQGQDKAPCAGGAHSVVPLPPPQRLPVAFVNESGRTILDKLNCDAHCETCGQLFFSVRPRFMYQRSVRDHPWARHVIVAHIGCCQRVIAAGLGTSAAANSSSRSYHITSSSSSSSCCCCCCCAVAVGVSQWCMRPHTLQRPCRPAVWLDQE